MKIYALKIYERLADELAASIRHGGIPAGHALPTLRGFAAKRRIGLSTATRVYAELQRRGLIVGEVGRGSFVREQAMGIEPESAAARYAARGRMTEAIDPRILRVALRTVAALPDLERLAAQSSPLGSSAVRNALSTHLKRIGTRAPASRIVMTNGGLAAMRLATLLRPGRGQSMATDAVTYPGWKLIGDQAGVQLVPIPLDQDGPIPDRLESLLRRRRIAAIHCMPTAHHPLGWVMPLERRRQIVALARAHDLALLEDVTYNHLALHSPPPFAALAPERTWQAGSLSGVLGDGLRVGFLVTPSRQEAALQRTALSWGLTAPPLILELARHWLDDGTVGRIQDAQTRHADRLWKAIRSTGLGWVGPSRAGWWLWLPLARRLRREEVVSGLRQQGIDAVDSEVFSATPRPPQAIAIRLRLLTPADIEALASVILAACA